ncbi:TIGR03564 family F420-dependent LLM class oxidoreductase [Lentzea sp. BCCO 10_0061]|uniref:TIGR03564 family F420-dependent LLM class oxidoreductase n=1 Tax=Lentzea sokolovensis TaxID=3095429 RepID=A0ABU4VDM9_9PSEU|nr:TIGR03564 family F420-dependent LLM class oxidoreductase [Lentzea sp. BCCO 10_0061]MDX8149015.1 TIGR03564 family F420-dependent LLM class oxidoreductase [Lentzea sp. BCCO 10_0061]
MKIGLAVGDVRGPATLDAVVDQVRVAADAGFATAWASQALGWDALTAIAVAGAAVPGIAVGTAVVPVPQRHPMMLAGQALTAQAAVTGRLTLGVGTGVAAMVSGMFGLPTDRPVQRMRDYLTVLGPLLRGDSVEYRGETLTAVGAVTVPGDVPAPSVIVAAMGPRMVRLAGELADGTVTWMTGPKTLGEHIVPTITKAAGGQTPRVVAGLPVCVTNTPDDVRARIADQFALAAQVPEYRATLDREGVAGPQDVAIVGTETQVAQALDRLRDAGVTEFMAAPCGTADEQNRTIDLLAGLTR